jgi:hypothetical protein
MQPRRSLRLLAGALVLALPVLSSCGFDKATDRVYTPAAGANNRDGDVDVLSAVIVAAQPNSGTFIASLSNNSPKDDAKLTGITGITGDSQDLSFAPVDPPIEIKARGFVNLVNEPPITVTGDFGAGDFERVTLTFESGDTVSLRIPVVFACDEWSGLDSSAEAGPSSGPQTDESESPSGSPSTEASPSESATAAAKQEPYDCAAVLSEN